MMHAVLLHCKSSLPVKNILKLLQRILQIPQRQEYVRSCKILPRTSRQMPIIFNRKKRTKSVFSTNNLSGKTKKYQESCQEIQETPRISPRNPEKLKKNGQETTRGLKIPVYNLAHHKKTEPQKFRKEI